MVARVTSGFMATQSRRVAQVDGPQRPVLLTAKGMAVARQEGLTMLPHHIGYFKGGAAHGN